ncbi:UNVERIFIED_CONTAM: hypothetical protein FKN15_061758 [Acipenser sinensis]
MCFVLNRKVIFEKQWLHLDNAIGQLYGTSFEVAAGGTLQAVKQILKKILKPFIFPLHLFFLETKEAGMDNRNIVDDGRSQKLTRDDIETLKDQGLKGQEIVQQVIENSSTFRDKTEFAQEKYIKKKKKKYDNTITVLKPSTRIMALMYHGREPGKICKLHYDTLAQMLTLGNIHAGSKLIVFETCAGLVLGAVMEQMGGYGSIIQMYPGGEPVRAATDSFGFPEHFYKTLHEFPLCKEIVQQLIENSSTFRDKTEFAQEKYIKKKKKKYDNTITVLKPSTRIMALMYHGREPGKICNLRYDTLAQMLTLGNIHAGSKLIVFETCAGLVLGAVMEQMGGYGSIIQMYPGGEPVRAATDSFGFPEHFYKTLHEFPLCKGQGGKPQKTVQKTGEEVEVEKGSAQASPEVYMVTIEEPEDKEKEEQADQRDNKAQEKKVKQEEKRKKHTEAAALLQGRNADGLVIASRFHPTPLVLSLLKLVGPSRPFVIYCQHVLPNRTHPMLLMSGGGGYISMSTGMTVDMDSAKSLGPQQTEEPAPKRQKLQDTES